MIVFLAFYWYTFSLDNTVPWSSLQNFPKKSNAISGRNNQFLKCFTMYHYVDLDFTIFFSFYCLTCLTSQMQAATCHVWDNGVKILDNDTTDNYVNIQYNSVYMQLIYDYMQND